MQFSRICSFLFINNIKILLIPALFRMVFNVCFIYTHIHLTLMCFSLNVKKYTIYNGEEKKKTQKSSFLLEGSMKRASFVHLCEMNQIQKSIQVPKKMILIKNSCCRVVLWFNNGKSFATLVRDNKCTTKIFEQLNG